MKPYKWHQENINKLKKYIIEQKSIHEIAGLMPEMTESGIRTKAADLGLKIKHRKKRWSFEEEQLLKQLYNEGKGSEELALRLKTSIPAIHSKCSSLKLKKLNEWSLQEDDDLKKHFSNGLSVSEISVKMGRSIAGIRNRSAKMGITNFRGSLVRQQYELRKQGLRRCCVCREIFEFSNVFFSESEGKLSRTCKTCSNTASKSRYWRRKPHISMGELIYIRWNQAKNRSRHAQIIFKLSEQDIIDIYNLQEGKCYYSGLKMSTGIGDINSKESCLSIDRVDSSKGYEKDNVVLCCTGINIMKNNLDKNEFINFCKLITLKHTHDYNDIMI